MRTCYLSLVLLASFIVEIRGSRNTCAFHYIHYLKSEFHRLCYGSNTLNVVVCSELTKKLTFCGVACKHLNSSFFLF